MLSRLSKPLAAALAALILALALPADAFARPGGGGSFGSRGSKTFSAPPVTNTAPRTAAPIGGERGPSQSSFAPQPARSSGGFLSSGIGRGLVGGLVGAGIFGLLTGNGLFGGLGDGMSFLGLLIQIGLVVLLVRFLIGRFRSRQQPAYANASAGRGAFAGNAGPQPDMRSGGGASATSPLQIESADFDAFQHRLGEVQTAYSAEDIGSLRNLATPEMANRFAEEITGNQRRGLSNRLSDVRMLQGDLSEAWRQGRDEFATVAMRYSLTDVMVDRNNGQLVSGSTNAPSEVTELWTFVRNAGRGPDGWVLSAIQQT